jgi:monoamine oxidase
VLGGLKSRCIVLHQAAEGATDEELVTAAMHVLERLFGEGIPQPTALVATRWGSEPYSRGLCHMWL